MKFKRAAYEIIVVKFDAYLEELITQAFTADSLSFSVFYSLVTSDLSFLTWVTTL